MARPIAACLLAAGLLSGCEPASTDIRIHFQATLNGQRIACSEPVQGIELSDLRFYIADAELVTSSGDRVPLNIGGNGRWQGDGLTLIDLEDGTGDCLNGTSDMNATLIASVPQGDYRSLRFTVGVPFSRNHADPLRAGAPLNDSTMHWHWRSGYKFFRAGLGSADGSVSVHLGSAGCEGTVQAISGCEFPNRFSVRLDYSSPTMPISVELAPLLQTINVLDGEAAQCTSGPAEQVCAEIFPIFGIDFTSGATLAAQQLFRAESR